MPRLPNSHARFQLRLSGWTAVIGVLVIVSAITAIAFFAVGLFILVLPALLIASAIRYFAPKPKSAAFPVGDEKISKTSIIDGTFQVVESNIPEPAKNSGRTAKTGT